MNLNEFNVSVLLFCHDRLVKKGDSVRTTGQPVTVPVGEALLGRYVDPLGFPEDFKGPLPVNIERRPIEVKAPGIVARMPIYESLETGIKVIDALIPIGKGQRELILGDRQTGKTTLAIDTILAQKEKHEDDPNSAVFLLLYRYWSKKIFY